MYVIKTFYAIFFVVDKIWGWALDIAIAFDESMKSL